MSVTYVTDRMPEFERAVRDLVKNEVLVGIPAEDAGRRPDPPKGKGKKRSKQASQPPNNATIGYWMEYGAPEANIPARPHLVPGIERAQSTITQQLRRAAEAALSGGSDGVDRGLNAAGIAAQNAVRATITDGDFAPLSRRTLAARRARGRTGDKPLIDTGQYRRSLTYVIRPKGA